MIQLQAIGRLGGDAEIKKFNNDEFLSFNVAVDEGYRGHNGEWVDQTTWVSCSFNYTEGNVKKHLKKGAMIFIQGRPVCPHLPQQNTQQNLSRCQLPL